MSAVLFTVPVDHAVRVTASPERPLTLISQAGSGTLYRKESHGPSATNNDGTTAAGSTLTLTAPTWLRASSTTNVVGVVAP